MTSSGRRSVSSLGLAYKDQIKLEHISAYRKLRLTFNVTFMILCVSALVFRPDVFLSHPAIAISTIAPLLVLMVIAALRITFYPCPYCETRLGWTPYYRKRCECCHDRVDLKL